MAKVIVKDGIGGRFMIPEQLLKEEMEIREQLYKDFQKVGMPEEEARKYLFEIVRVED